MASRTKTYKIGADLDDAMALLAVRFGYPSVAAFLKGMARHACLTQASHTTSLPWALLPFEKQDKLDEALLKLVKEGKGMTSAQAAKMTFGEIIARAGLDQSNAS